MKSIEILKVNAETPFVFISAGQFFSDVPWTHVKRCINSFEIIIGVRGVLYIQQDDTQYQISAGDVLLLLPGRVHKGYQACESGVSFYWFHFICSAPYEIVTENELTDEFGRLGENTFEPKKIESVYIPVLDHPERVDRINILFHQMQHLANSNSLIYYSIHYLLTSLLIELSEQALTKFLKTSRMDVDRRISDILEWIRLHSSDQLSVSSIANKFGYNKDYFTRFFKRKMGKTVQEYILMQKLSKVKDLLTRTNLSIKEISCHIGMNDDKYLLKLFKKYENMTPTEFRKAYYLKYMNNE